MAMKWIYQYKPGSQVAQLFSSRRNSLHLSQMLWLYYTAIHIKLKVVTISFHRFFLMTGCASLFKNVLQTFLLHKTCSKTVRFQGKHVLDVFYNWHRSTSASLVPTHLFFNFQLTQTWSLAASYWTSNMFEKQLQGWTSQMPTWSILCITDFKRNGSA